MAVTVYANLYSQPSRSLIIFLRHTQISFEFKRIDLGKLEQKTPAFGKITPLRTVPAIKDGEFCLAETVAIVRYLTAKYPDKVADHWYPKDLEKRARVDEYLAWHEGGTRDGCCGLFKSKFPISYVPAVYRTPEMVKLAEENAAEKMNKLEEAFLSKNEFLARDDISFADIFAVNEIIHNTAVGYDHTEGRPVLKAFIDRVRSRLNPIFDEVCSDIYDLKHVLSKQAQTEPHAK